MVAHTCNPKPQDTEARGSQVEGQLRLHSETVSQKEKERKNILYQGHQK